MHVGLFIPCYVDQLEPGVGLATVALLEEQGVQPIFPREQTCCGQPFFSAGATPQARRLARRHLEIFAAFDHVVTPSGSCAATVRRHLPELVPGSEAERVASNTFELCEFLVDVLRAPPLAGELRARVGLNASCHGLRALRLGSPSEISGGPEGDLRDPARVLLSGIAGIELVEPTRADECCGFGGLFSVEEEAVSVRMGEDRLKDHLDAGAEILTSTDVSCLLHLSGLARRHGMPIRILHIAELLASRRAS